VLYRCSGNTFGGKRAAVMSSRRARRFSNGLKRGIREEKRPLGDDEGPLMFRYVCCSCSSFRGWYAVRRLGERKVFHESSTKGGGSPDGAGGGL